MSEYGEEQEDHASALARWFPLYFRRLTKKHLQLIAETLGLSSKLSKEELDRGEADGDAAQAGECSGDRKIDTGDRATTVVGGQELSRLVGLKSTFEHAGGKVRACNIAHKPI